MKNFFRFLLSISLAIGSGFLGYFIAKKKYEKLADIEVETVKNKLIDYYKNQQADHNKGKESTDETTKCKKDNTVITQISSIEKNQTTEDKYINYAKQYMTENVEKNVEAREEASKKNKKHTNEPYIIDVMEYENSNFIAKTLYYYTKENILTDYEGRHIEQFEELIGSQANEELSKSNFDSFYVRNEKLEADFEIIIINGSVYNVHSKERVISEEYEK